MHVSRESAAVAIVSLLLMATAPDSKQLFLDASLSQTSVATYNPDNRAATGGIHQELLAYRKKGRTMPGGVYLVRSGKRIRKCLW
ncbi:MAG: hypothetical protein JW913_06680 [Chitinispirillaceae bacterium]|nr:hypothetical protein [Chitinispirillaceae bacterium]